METLRIGDWLADPEANELRRGTETVRLEPKAMAVLMRLAARPGRLVSREDLFAQVWPGVVVGDEALTQCIIKLRRALGDQARAAGYIETISKRGYRLIAPVGDAAPPATARPPRNAWRIGALAALAAAALGAAVLHVQPGPAPESAVPAGRSSAITLTVLPFEAVGDGEHAYLARGISHDLMTELSRLAGLQVIAPSLAPTAAPDAGARYVVSGSVQRLGESLRVNVRLVDAASGQQLWSQRYERPFAELFALQNEMLASVAALLPGKVAEAARERSARRYTRSLEAYDWFLRGQASFLVRQARANAQAREFYRKALELDPKFARAYAGLAMTYAMEHRLRPTDDPAPSLARALELAQTALLIDPDIPEVHWALGFVHVQGRRHEQAMRALQKAIELNPSFADAYAFLGGIHTYLGQPGKSIPLLRTAMRLNPDGGYLYYLLLGRAYLFENDVEQALINLREASARNPVDLETRIYLAAAMVAAGDGVAADWEAELIRSLDGGFTTARWLQTYPLTSERHKDRLLRLLGAAGL